jgi:hypothetical protein
MDALSSIERRLAMMSPLTIADWRSSMRPLACTFPSMRPKTTRSRTSRSAVISALGPTVRRLSARWMVPSKRPSRNRSSLPESSPRMLTDLPISVEPSGGFIKRPFKCGKEDSREPA